MPGRAFRKRCCLCNEPVVTSYFSNPSYPFFKRKNRIDRIKQCSGWLLCLPIKTLRLLFEPWGADLQADMMQFAEDVRAYSRYAAEFDAPIRCELLYGDAHAAVSRIAGKYRIAFSFPRKFDVEVGLARYAPVVNAMQSYLPDGSRDPVQAVLNFTSDLQRTYQKEVLSASSKFLWFFWGRDILTYDSRALATLQRRFPTLRPKDYLGYCSAWVTLFAECEEQVAKECALQGVANERWFHERVFDWHLWRSGK